jgi:signal transduction histidine kinase
LVEVHDNGLGIHPDNIHRVFEPFFTTRLGQGGSGLGLHIVHNLVTGVLGGSIDVHSHPEQGTTFSLLLPTVAPAQTDAAKLTSAQN